MRPAFFRLTLIGATAVPAAQPGAAVCSLALVTLVKSPMHTPRSNGYCATATGATLRPRGQRPIAMSLADGRLVALSLCSPTIACAESGLVPGIIGSCGGT